MSSGFTLQESERLCRRLAKSHYENFLVASILLPRRLRQPFYNIYAFCRTADDAADESADRDEALRQLTELQGGIDAMFQGDSPTQGLFPALAATVSQYSLDKQPFDDLLSAFRQDQHVTDYESNEQLVDYCRRSANPVGRLVLQLAGQLSDATTALSDEICTGLQLANFWQDVARDFQIGRVYLPADLRDEYGVETAMLAMQTTPDPLRRLLARLCEEADGYFDRGLPLADHVPRWLAADIRLFAHGGKETLRAIRNVEFDVLRTRPTVGKRTQFALVAKACLGLI